MTENEAIEIINIIWKNLYKPRKAQEALDIAISALQEIQQYREIGTVEECWAAVEKQKPKKPIDFKCPSCGCCIVADEFLYYKYCLNCGQKLE